mmetsp:Transcript_4877/g.9721  ORF Transcript_4877/g.9721 Transcript_4877/m.9721 type:complete len:96 (-) Transcript_4877:1779-2066(-)
MRTPNRAPVPDPTITAVGVASPRAQGQDMTKHAIPKVKLKVAGPSCKSSYHDAGTTPDMHSAYHAMYVSKEIKHTEGTNTEDTLSANDCIGTDRV